MMAGHVGLQTQKLPMTLKIPDKEVERRAFVRHRFRTVDGSIADVPSRQHRIYLAVLLTVPPDGVTLRTLN